MCFSWILGMIIGFVIAGCIACNLMGQERHAQATHIQLVGREDGYCHRWLADVQRHRVARVSLRHVSQTTFWILFIVPPPPPELAQNAKLGARWDDSSLSRSGHIWATSPECDTFRFNCVEFRARCGRTRSILDPNRPRLPKHRPIPGNNG